MDAWLIHTCRVRRTPETELDALGADRGRSDTVPDRISCRLVIKDQRVGDGVFAERPIITTYTLLARWDADIRAGDEIVNVVFEDGTEDDRIYRIESLLPRRSNTQRHKSAKLEVIG